MPLLQYFVHSEVGLGSDVRLLHHYTASFEDKNQIGKIDCTPVQTHSHALTSSLRNNSGFFSLKQKRVDAPDEIHKSYSGENNTTVETLGFRTDQPLARYTQ